MNFRNNFKPKSQESAVGVRSAGTIILVVDVVSFGIGLTENQNALQRWKCVRFVRKLAVQCRNVRNREHSFATLQAFSCASELILCFSGSYMRGELSYKIVL